MNVLILSIYLFFMFNIFETNITFNHPLEFYLVNNLGSYFEHPIDNVEYGNKICTFGHNAILVLIMYLLLSEYFFIEYKIYSKYVLIITIILSLLNLNALVYLIPYIIYEISFV